MIATRCSNNDDHEEDDHEKDDHEIVGDGEEDDMMVATSIN